MTTAMGVAAGFWVDDDDIVVGDRQLRQLRMLALADGSDPALATPSGSEGSDLARVARALGISTVFTETNGAPDISNEWRARGLRVSVIVASHNYGHYLAEAVGSVLAQSYLPDEILLSDDASSDDSAAIMARFAEEHPDLVTVNVNRENLGIDRHFNVAISQTTGDVVMFLGADNRIPPHYVECCLSALVGDPTAAIAYTDFALFGSRATVVHDSLRDTFRGSKLDYGLRLSNFPEFNDASRTILDSGVNFIHGSSLYRRSAFDEVGGYGSRADGPEDMQLFQAMIAADWKAKKVSGVYLEYRQHSLDQANMQFSLYRELHGLRKERDLLLHEKDLLQQDNERLREFVERVRGSLPYRVLMKVSSPYRRLKRRR
jgi:glycosyltransferase involved in cell wall biosynthesis